MKTNARPVHISRRRSLRMPPPDERRAVDPAVTSRAIQRLPLPQVRPGRPRPATGWTRRRPGLPAGYWPSAVSIADDVAETTGAGSSLFASICAVIALLNASLTLL